MFQECSSRLEIDFFAFESWLTVSREFVPCPDFIQLKDISHWKERVPISAANSYDSAFPPLIKYNSEPSPQVGVTIPHESGFQVHCDCKASAINIGAIFEALGNTNPILLILKILRFK